MKLSRLPLRLKAGRIVRLRLQQLPAAQHSHLICPAGSEDSGWRVQAEPCLDDLWQRLSCADFSPCTRADWLVLVHALPAVDAPSPGLLPRRWCGRDVRPWVTDAAGRRALLDALDCHRHAEEEAHDDSVVVTPRAAQFWEPWLRARGLHCHVELEKHLALLASGHELDREALVAILLQDGHLDWLPLIAMQPVELRLSLLRAIVDTARHVHMPPAGMRKLLETLRHAVERSQHARVAKICLQSLANGGTPRFVARALRFHLRWKLKFETLACPRHEPDWRELHKVIHCDVKTWFFRPANVWKQATRLQDWSSAIRRLFARNRPRCVLEAVIRGMHSAECRSRRKQDDRWSTWLERWDDMLSALDALPRGKLPVAAEFIKAWRVNPEHAIPSRRSVEHMIRWVRRAGTFEKRLDVEVTSVIEAVWTAVESRAADRDALLQVPESVWLAMQPSLRGKSARWNAIQGIWRARDLEQGVLLRLILASPLKWVRTMRLIGELEWKERHDVWEAFREHPLMSCDVTRMPLCDAIVVVDCVRDSHRGLPGVPDKLRAHSTSMPTHVRTHYLEELRRNADRLLLAVLHQLAEWGLRRRFPMLRGETVTTHTLRVATSTGEENRRPMRRLIRACDQGVVTRASLVRHPANQRWIRQHPAQRISLWNDGFVIERAIEGLGAVRFGPEDDAQAILRMGTEFGTCLSAGSFNSFATASNVLDANKRVIYARDAQGRTLARQLVAIAESGHLVCFQVFARKHHAAMRHLFAAYDHALAQMLRLPLWQSRDESAMIAKLVCREWYDDGAWNP